MRYRPAFIRRLIEIRGERNQRQQALRLGWKQQTLNRYERGESVPHLDSLVEIAEKEDVSLDWLILGRGTRDGHRA